MKKFIVVALILFSAGAFASQSPCYYRITVEGDCQCTLEGMSCPEGAVGSGIYREDAQASLLVPVITDLTDWTFEGGGDIFIISTSTELIACQGIVQNQQAIADPNFSDCESDGPSSFQFDVYGHDGVIGESIYRYTITFTRLCTCEEYLNQLSEFEYQPDDPELPCNCDCETNPACGADDDIDDHQGEADSDKIDVGAQEPGIGDPIIPGSGAIVMSLDDIHVPGRMMDIDLVRTYRGDIDDPGFTRTFYSPGKGLKIKLSGGEDFEDFDFPDQLSTTFSTTASSSDPIGSSITLPAFEYTFMKILDSRWILNSDCYNVELGDPNDPDENGLIRFDDIDGGTVTVQTDYCVYGTNDPNGEEPLLYFNSHSAGTVHSTHERTFTYDMSKYTCRLGRKWDNNFNISLHKVNDPNESAPQRYILLAGNGKKLFYTQKIAEYGISYSCPSDPGSVLVSTVDGFELRKRGGTTWKFNSDLYISAIEDINGNRITFTYSNDLLYRVTNDAGNYITFYYDQYNMIDRITDNLGRTWDYNRDANFDLIEVVTPFVADDATNVKQTYTYTEGNLLDTAIDGAGQVWLDNTYNELDRIITQRYGANSYANTYHFDQDGKVSYVDTYDRKGNLEKVYLTDSGLMRKTSKQLDAGEWADTVYYYDFDITQTPELENKCLVQKIEMPAGDIYEFEYDYYGNTTLVAHKNSANDDGLITKYTYYSSLWGLPSSATDAEGNVTKFTYDSIGNLVTITQPEVYVSDANDIDNVYLKAPEYKFEYNQYGQVTKLTLPDGINVVCTYYNGSGKYWVKTITYDYGTGSDNMNLTISYDYDQYGNITSITDSDGVHQTYVYDNVSHLKEVISALNIKTYFHYNKSGLLDKANYQLGDTYKTQKAITETFEYTSVDRLKKITDSLGRITELGFDENDNIDTVTDPQGKVSGYHTAYEYNAQNLIESIILPADYDSDPGNDNVTTFTYYSDGLTKTATDAMGQTTAYYYDGYRRLSTVLYPDGTSQCYTYDKVGNVISESNRDGSFIYYQYDAAGRMCNRVSTSVESAVVKNNILTDFLGTGTWNAVLDAECISGRYVSSNDGAASYSLCGFGGGAGKYAVAVRYVSFGTTSNPNVKVQLSDEMSGTIANLFIDQQANGDKWIYLGMFDFESMPKVTFWTNGDTRITTVDAVMVVPALVYNYDVNGRLTKVQSNEFSYDRAGRIISAKDGFDRIVSYEYTPAGRRSKVVWPDGYYVTYGYDAAGRFISITDSSNRQLWSCTYDALGRRTSTTGFYGVTSQYDYEDIGPSNNNQGTYLKGLDWTINSNDILSFVYTRDLDGNITGVSRSWNSQTGTLTYSYDQNYSLTSVTFADNSQIEYDYDNIFNRTELVDGSAVTLYTSDAEDLSRYSIAGSNVMDYDMNGNMTASGTKHYLYDTENHMVAYYKLEGDPNQALVSFYGYDVFGRRTSRSVSTGLDSVSGSIAESYLYDGEQAIGEYTTDNKHIKRRYIYGPGIDEPIAMIVEPDHQGYYGYNEFAKIADSWLGADGVSYYSQDADYDADGTVDFSDMVVFLSDYYMTDRPLIDTPKVYGYCFDGMGSVIGLTFCNDPNVTNNPYEEPYFVETYNYDPFGNPSVYGSDGQLKETSSIANPYMFTGRRYDNESGLYYYRMRMYNPEAGRFMQADPLGYYDSMNLYQYCGNNPVNYVDPWGLSKEGDAAADWARGQRNNSIYGARMKEYMVAKFVRDAYRQSGAPYPRRWWNRESGAFWPLYPSLDPPTENELANPGYNVPNFPVVNGNGKKINMDDLQPGDILSFRFDGHHVRGHTAIYVGDGKMAQASITMPGAHITNINPKLWKMIQAGQGTVRRYTPTP